MTLRDLVILGSSSQQPTRARNHGAYLLRWNQRGFLIDPGEGTQRQFIFAGVAPPTVTDILITHFHGDHCLGLGSMLMRLNLDKVTHPIHCYYPASGKVYFDRLRYSTIYHETIEVIEHPIKQNGIVRDDGEFIIEAYGLEHGVDNFGYRITEADKRKFDREKLEKAKVFGPNVRLLEEKGSLDIEGNIVTLEQVSWIQKGTVVAVISDTRFCTSAINLAKDATLLLCESTYLEEHKQLAKSHFHLTAKEAATIAKKAGVTQLVLTHFSARYLDTSLFTNEAAEIFPNVIAAKDGKIIAF